MQIFYIRILALSCLFTLKRVEATLIAFTVFFGICPSPILNALHYSVSTLIYNYNEPSFAFLLSLPISSASGLRKLNLTPYYMTGFIDASTKSLVVFGSNLCSTVGKKFTRTQLATVVLANHTRDIIVGLLLSDG